MSDKDSESILRMKIHEVLKRSAEIQDEIEDHELSIEVLEAAQDKLDDKLMKLKGMI